MRILTKLKRDEIFGVNKYNSTTQNLRGNKPIAWAVFKMNTTILKINSLNSKQVGQDTDFFI